LSAGDFDRRLRYFCTGKTLPDFQGREVIWRLDARDSDLSDKRRRFAMEYLNDQFFRYLENEGPLYSRYMEANRDIDLRVQQAKNLPGFDPRKYDVERKRLFADYGTARDARRDEVLADVRRIQPWR
jgi:hypothetical protein